MANCLVAQSGGPTAVINASLSGVIEAALNSPEIANVYGSLNGVVGMLEDRLVLLNSTFENQPENLALLKSTPGMYLGSCRFKLADPAKDDSQFKKIFDLFETYDIGYFFYIGGNDSMDTVYRLSQYAAAHNKDVKIMGVPKTIDNDLCGTDHTPGFGSAAKYVATSILEIAHDTYIYDKPSVTIIEIMGRHAGWLAASAALARTAYSPAPDFIYLPEVPFSLDMFKTDVENLFKTKKNIIIAVSEGIHDADGKFISATEAKNDAFGHAQLSGTGKFLENYIKDALGCKARSVELNVLQRSAAHCASLTDVTEAAALGAAAVAKAIAGATGEMAVVIREQDAPYTTRIETYDISLVANQEKVIPREWINEAGNDVTEAMMTYLRPLIVGENNIIYENGMPKFMPIDHLI